MIRIILRENVSRLGNIAEHNVDFLSDDDRFDQQILGDVPWSKIEQILYKIVGAIPVLSDSKILSRIGAGVDGVAFELSNGNVLKIGKEGASVSSALETSKEDNFTGRGSSSLLHVYGRGKIEIGTVLPLFWREVPRYTTFTEWLRQVLPNRPPQEIKKLLHAIEFTAVLFYILMKNYTEKVGQMPSLKNIIKISYKHNEKGDLVLAKLGKEFYERLAKAVYELGKRAGFSERLDLNIGNFGLDQHGNIVFFDF